MHCIALHCNGCFGHMILKYLIFICDKYKYQLERNTDAKKLDKSNSFEHHTNHLSQGSGRGKMWKQDLKKIAMLTVGVGGALALYNSR